MLRVARSSAIKARTQAANQLRDLLVTAPDDLRAQLHRLSTSQAGRAPLARSPPAAPTRASATRRALWHLARRHQALTAELAALNTELAALTRQAAPRLLGRPGVGIETAGQLLVTAGDNPDRLHSEAALAALCGASPVEASSGKTVRHRLNRGGDRQANNALWVIALTRLRDDPRTRSLRRAAYQPGQDHQGDHALPQALPRPRAVPAAQGRPPGGNRRRLSRAGPARAAVLGGAQAGRSSSRCQASASHCW